MNIKELKEYIKELPDEMDTKIEIDWIKYDVSLKVEENKLTFW